jgi:hypothetical protein
MSGGYIERLRSPASRALRDAGPPNGLLFGALIASVAVSLAIWGNRAPGTGVWLTLGAVALVLTSLVALADRDGWLIRESMAWVALQQRARWTWGDLPVGVAEAVAWLEDPANRDAPALARASVLMTGDRWSEAAQLLDDHVPSDPAEAATRIRMRLAINARGTGSFDQAAVQAATQGLPEPDAKYLLASAAWSQAWIDLTSGRPWRRDFARASRALRPYPLPMRVRAWIAAQQMLAPITCIVGVALAALLHAVGLAS